MKMAAAAGNGDEQVRIEGSTAHDPAEWKRLFFPYESLIFPPSLLRKQLGTEPPSSEGGNNGWRPRLTVMINRKDYYWAQL